MPRICGVEKALPLPFSRLRFEKYSSNQQATERILMNIQSSLEIKGATVLRANWSASWSRNSRWFWRSLQKPFGRTSANEYRSKFKSTSISTNLSNRSTFYSHLAKDQPTKRMLNGPRGALLSTCCGFRDSWKRRGQREKRRRELRQNCLEFMCWLSLS